jgi:hypothetical protein
VLLLNEQATFFALSVKLHGADHQRSVRSGSTKARFPILYTLRDSEGMGCGVGGRTDDEMMRWWNQLGVVHY